MNELLSYYNTLLGIEVTIFGIIIATIFVFIQLIYSRFSYREVRVVLGGWKLVLLVLIGLMGMLAVVLTGLASMLLALGSYDFFVASAFKSMGIITNKFFVLFLPFPIFITTILFSLWIIQNFKYLYPGKILLLFGRKISNEFVRKFLLNKYGIPSPDRPFPIIFTIEHAAAIKEIEEEMKEEILGEKVIKKPKSAERSKLEGELKAQEKKSQADLKVYKRMLRDSNGARDPFESMQQIALQALNTTDLNTYFEHNREVLRITSSFFASIQEPLSFSDWDPERNLARNFVENFFDNALVQIEVSDNQGLHSVRLSILDASKEIAQELIARKQYDALNALVNFWKRIADKYLLTDRKVFKRTISHLRKTTESLFKLDNEEIQSLDEMFRVLGWLGEKLLITKSIERKPLMPDEYDNSEFDELMETIHSIGNKYNYEHPNWYPLIFFDLVDVIFTKVVEIPKDQFSRLNETIFDLVYFYSSFGEKAISVGNGRGAELAAMRLYGAIEHLERLGLEERQQESIELLLHLAASAAGNKDKYTGAGLTNPTIDDWALEKIARLTTSYKISKEILEIVIKGGGNREGQMEFIRKLGKRMGSSFGLNLEPINKPNPPL